MTGTALDPGIVSIALALLGLLTLIVNGFILIRTGKTAATVATIGATTDATHALVNGQQAAIVNAATTIATNAGFAAGAATAAAGAAEASAP